MKQLHHPFRTRFTCMIVLAFLAACGASTPAGVETDDVRGTWSGTLDAFSVMGRTLSGDVDWTFTRDTFELIFFDPPEDQAERIEGKWKFTDGRIAIELTSSFPIDDDIGAKDTLFVSILRDEMSLKTIAQSSILLVKTRLASADRDSGLFLTAQPSLTLPHVASRQAAPIIVAAIPRNSEFRRADIRLYARAQHPPI